MLNLIDNNIVRAQTSHRTIRVTTGTLRFIAFIDANSCTAVIWPELLSIRHDKQYRNTGGSRDCFGGYEDIIYDHEKSPVSSIRDDER